MNELLKILLSLSISGSLLIIILLLCKFIFKVRFSKQWQYYIWLIVIARLILPFAPETNIMGSIFNQIDSRLPQMELTTSSIKYDIITDFDENEVSVDYQGHSTIDETSNDNMTVTNNVLSKSIQNIWLAWLIVMVALFIRKITVYQSFVKYINAGRVDVLDIEIWERVSKLVERVGVKKSVSIYTNSLISSPLLVGFFNPCIMLPTTELSNLDFEYTILHELTHYKRKDMFYKWLVQSAICVHWFNPFVHLIGHEINRACELSCDEAVIRKLDKQGQLAYGDTLLNAMGMGGIYKDTIASITLYESQELLKERLGAIMKYKKASKITISIMIVITLVLAVGATTMGAYATVPTELNKINNSSSKINYTVFNSRTSKEVSALQDFTDDKVKSINLTGKSCGIELVKSESNKFTFDYVGVEDLTKFKVNCNLKGDVLEIAADGSAARAVSENYYIDNGVNSINVVKIGIPDNEYENLTMALYEAPISLPDFNAEVNIKSEDGSISISDKNIYKGSYNINSTSGGVSIDADTVLSNVYIKNNGECDIIFNQIPKNLSLDLTACQGKIVLPDGWTNTQIFGDGIPSIKLNNFGYTEIQVSDLAEKLKVDSFGKIEIPVDISSLSSGSEICLGAIPDLRNAKAIHYDVNGEAGGSLFVGISPESNKGTKHFWVGSVESATRNIIWDSDKSVCYSKKHDGDYYVYIQSKYGDCSNITGSIVIEY